MNVDSLKDESRRINRITRVGMISNLGLTLIKLFVGFTIGSIALVADGFHSLSDLATDFAVLVGTAIAVKPADHNHPFGHGKFETFTVVFVAVALILVGAGIVWEALRDVSKNAHAGQGVWIVVVAFLSLVVKEWLYRATMKVAEQCRSSALRANAWHHRSDALSSVVVLVGGGATWLGWGYGDHIAGMLVGLMVIAVGGKLGFDAFRELSEASASQETISHINEIIGNLEEVRGTHRLRVRQIGRELIMDIHVVLDPELTIRQGHEIVRKVEDAISNGIEWPISVTVHVDPDDEEIVGTS